LLLVKLKDSLELKDLLLPLNEEVEKAPLEIEQDTELKGAEYLF